MSASSDLILDTFDVITTELAATFSKIDTLRLRYSLGHIARSAYRQEVGKLCRKAHRLMKSWEKAGLDKGVLG